MRPPDEQDVRALCGTFYSFDPHKILFKYHQVAMLFDIRFQLVAGGAQSTTTMHMVTEHGVQDSLVGHYDGGWPDPNPDFRTDEPVEMMSLVSPSDILRCSSRMEGSCIGLPPCYDDSEPVVQTPSHRARPIVPKSKRVLFVPSCLFMSLL